MVVTPSHLAGLGTFNGMLLPFSTIFSFSSFHCTYVGIIPPLVSLPIPVTSAATIPIEMSVTKLDVTPLLGWPPILTVASSFLLFEAMAVCTAWDTCLRGIELIRPFLRCNSVLSLTTDPHPSCAAHCIRGVCGNARSLE